MNSRVPSKHILNPVYFLGARYYILLLALLMQMADIFYKPHERSELIEEPATKKLRLEEPPAYRMLCPAGMLQRWKPSVMKYMF